MSIKLDVGFVIAHVHQEDDHTIKITIGRMNNRHTDLSLTFQTEIHVQRSTDSLRFEFWISWK